MLMLFINLFAVIIWCLLITGTAYGLVATSEAIMAPDCNFWWRWLYGYGVAGVVSFYLFVLNLLFKSYKLRHFWREQCESPAVWEKQGNGNMNPFPGVEP